MISKLTDGGKYRTPQHEKLKKSKMINKLKKFIVTV